MASLPKRSRSASDLAPLLVRRVRCLLGEDRLQYGDDGGSLLWPDMRECVPHPMHPTALVTGTEHLACRRSQTFVVVGDDELHAAQAAIGKAAQEALPERLGLQGTGGHAEHLAPPLGVDRNGDYHGRRDDAAALALLQVGGVDPEIWPLALDRARQKGVHPLVDLDDQPAHLALRDATRAHRLHQIVNRAGRHAMDVSFLNHRRQRLLRGSTRLQEAGKVAAPPELRDRQLDPPGARVPGPLTIAVALVEPVRRAGAHRHPRPGFDFHLHHALGGKRQHAAHQIRIRLLLDQLQQGHLRIGHLRLLQVRVRIRTLAEDRQWPPHP